MVKNTPTNAGGMGSIPGLGEISANQVQCPIHLNSAFEKPSPGVTCLSEEHEGYG